LKGEKSKENKSLSYISCICSLIYLSSDPFGQTFELKISKVKLIEKDFEGNVIDTKFGVELDEVYSVLCHIIFLFYVTFYC
jgi:hypothetical protein